ncbi:MAG: ABC transporter transmembrane domain-containing protein [Rubrobacteraceae bacterium]
MTAAAGGGGVAAVGGGGAVAVVGVAAPTPKDLSQPLHEDGPVYNGGAIDLHTRGRKLTRLRDYLRRLLIVTGEGESLVKAAPLVSVGELFRRFWPYARPFRGWILLTLVFVAVGPAVEAATIWIYKILVDEVLVPQNFGLLVWVALAYLGLTVLDGIVSFFDDYLSSWIGEQFVLSLRTSFFEHLQGLSLDFFDRRRLGDVLSRLTDDVDDIEELVVSGVTAALSYMFQLVFFVGALFYLQWRLALISLFVVPLFWLAARYFSRLIKAAAREEGRRSGSISAAAEESLSNATLVQAYNRQEDEVRRLHKEGVGSFEAQMASTRLGALFSPLVNIIELAGVLVVVAFGAYELSQGRLTLGGLLVFLVFLSRLYSPVRGFSSLINTFYAASAGAERILEFLDEEPAVEEKETATELRDAAGRVTFEDVSFYYPQSGHPTLTAVSFSAGPGETLALVGPSGAGKSTVARLLLRFYDPSSGKIRLDGHDLRDLSLMSLRENVAVLLQETLIFDGTVRQNIAYGKPGATEDQVVAAAKAADAHEFISRFPEGYDTVIGQKGRLLSGGQRQRVAIARAMVRDAPVLVLDEPTTGLDAAATRKIMEPLRRLMRGRTVIIISHNLMTVREADRILVIEDGQITECGVHEQLMERDGAYALLYHLHQQDGTSGNSAPGTEPERSMAVENEDWEDYTDGEYPDDHTDEPLEGPPPLEPGEEVLEGYNVIGHLHRSGNYDVYDVYSRERASRCVCKVPAPDRDEPEVAQRLIEEGKLLQQLTHPHIVRLYEIHEEPKPALILETLTGQTLAYLIDESPGLLPVGDVVQLGLHLCSAVHYLHGRGILHLDLKPSNIVAENQLAKVLDLSIARPPGLGKKGLGTSQYLAPEQALGDEFTTATDVWGLGAVLFEALTGEIPFEDSTGEGDQYEQLERRLEPVGSLRSVPEPLAEAIDSCLNQDPENRPTIEELIRVLKELAHNHEDAVGT